MVQKVAQIALFGNSLYAFPLHMGEFGVRFFGVPSIVNCEASDEEVGAWALRTLLDSNTEWKPGVEESAGVRELLALTQCKSWSAFAKKARFVWLDIDPDAQELVLKPMKSVRGGQESIPELARRLPVEDTAGIGASVRESLSSK